MPKSTGNTLNIRSMMREDSYKLHLTDTKLLVLVAILHLHLVSLVVCCSNVNANANANAKAYEIATRKKITIPSFSTSRVNF